MRCGLVAYAQQSRRVCRVVAFSRPGDALSVRCGPAQPSWSPVTCAQRSCDVCAGLAFSLSTNRVTHAQWFRSACETSAHVCRAVALSRSGVARRVRCGQATYAMWSRDVCAVVPLSMSCSPAQCVDQSRSVCRVVLARERGAPFSVLTGPAQYALQSRSAGHESRDSTLVVTEQLFGCVPLHTGPHETPEMLVRVSEHCIPAPCAACSARRGGPKETRLKSSHQQYRGVVRPCYRGQSDLCI